MIKLTKLLLAGLCLLCLGGQEARAQLYEAVVAQDGSGDYLTIQDAILSIRDYNPAGRQRILVRKGIYEEKVVVPAYKTNISLIGENRDSCILVWHDHANLTGTGHFEGVVLGSTADAHGNSALQPSAQHGHRLGTFETYTLLALGEGFECENMTICNDAMLHFNPNWRRDQKNEAGVAQAVTLHSEADRAVYRNCRILGFQDTVFTGNGRSRQLFYNCYIEGTVDFIFGPATVWFERCQLHALTDGYITAASTPADNPYGYVFNRCRVTADARVKSLYLGRPWRNYASVLFKECQLPAQLNPAGWSNWNDPAREHTARFSEYRNTGEGARPTQRVSWSRQLTQPESTRIYLDKLLYQGATQWKTNVLPVNFRDVHFAFYDENIDRGTRYVAGTLEPATIPDDPATAREDLVICLEGVDCTTLVEYLAAAIVGRVPSPEPTDSIFTHYVEALRYRGGVRGNYATRKHYFSEWISDGESLGLMTELTATMNGARQQKKRLNFMTQNPKLYPMLDKSPALVREMEVVEQALSEQTTWYIPKNRIHEAYGQMRHGDIVAFVTDKSGLDVQHVGFVWWSDTQEGEPQLFHASSALGRACIDVRSLEQYAVDASHCLGIRIIRLKQ